MATKIYLHQEAAITWRSAGGTNAITCTSLATVSGRQGAYHDLTTSARARVFAWRAWMTPGATRVVGQEVRIYLTTGDGTHYDNDDGTGDIALSAADKLRNVAQVGSIIIDENAAVEMGASGFVEISARYVAPIIYNATANTLSATATDYGFDLIPLPDEVQ